eukprot:SM000202S05867  [mRNA]  locus=s202:30309:32133:- [translate_table: standard]
MASLSRGLGGEIGLAVLLSPMSSRVVVRAACTVIGVAVPVYSTFKALERRSQEEQEEWLIYWSVYGTLSIAESLTDKLLSWCPFYYHAKMALLAWLQIPQHFGARRLYSHYLRPFLRHHQARVDRWIDGAQGELNQIVRMNQQELQSAARTVRRVASAVYSVAEESVRAVASSDSSNAGHIPSGTSGPAPEPAVELPDGDDDQAGLRGWVQVSRNVSLEPVMPPSAPDLLPPSSPT